MIVSLRFANVCDLLGLSTTSSARDRVAARVGPRLPQRDKSMTISRRSRVVILACGLLAGGQAFAQTFGSIDGEARDASGAAIAGVTVSVVNKGTNAARSAITNDA